MPEVSQGKRVTAIFIHQVGQAAQVGAWRRLTSGGVLEALDDGCLAAAVLAQDQSQGVGGATVAIAEGNHLEKIGLYGHRKIQTFQDTGLIIVLLVNRFCPRNEIYSVETSDKVVVFYPISLHPGRRL